jgi:hypothetical protein
MLAAVFATLIATAAPARNASGHAVYGQTATGFGTLNLQSSTSARNLKGILHSWSSDFPGISGAGSSDGKYCSAQVASDHSGTIYVFFGSGCQIASASPRFADSAILAYNGRTNTSRVFKGVPTARYSKDPTDPTGPQFGTPFFDPQSGKFIVVTESVLPNYEFRLFMILAFDPRTGVTTSVLELEAFHDIVSYVHDAATGKFYATVWDVYQHRSHVVIVDVGTGKCVNSADAPVPPAAGIAAFYAGFDVASGKTLAIKNVASETDPSMTNYHYGFYNCTTGKGCTFVSEGELDGMWCGRTDIQLLTDKIDMRSVAYDPLSRVLSVQSMGCYNLTFTRQHSTGHYKKFNCENNLGSEKLYQYHLGSALETNRAVKLSPTYTYAQVTDYNDNKAFSWHGLFYNC